MAVSVVGKEQNVIVCGSDKQMLDEILVLRPHTSDTAPPAMLAAIGIDGNTFDVSAVRNGDHHIFDRNQIFDIDLLGGHDNLTSPLIPELFGDLIEFIFDDAHPDVTAVENFFKASYFLHQCLILVLDFLLLETGQTL